MPKEKVTKTPEEMVEEKVKMQNVELANGYAEANGYENIQDMNKQINEKINSKNPAVKSVGMREATQTVKDLIKLILVQEVETTPEAEYITKLANMFDDGIVNRGNGKEYVASKLTGKDSWDPSKFVPNKVSTTSVEYDFIEMYDSTKPRENALNDYAYQFKKPKTIQEPEWLPYFVDGRLQEFISDLRAELRKVFDIYKYDKIATLITSAAPTNSKCTVNGEADNMFDALAGEFLPLAREFTLMNNRYNYDENSKFIQAVKPEDIVVVMSTKNLQRLQSGIKTQLYNAHLLDFENVLEKANYTTLGRKFNIQDSETDITMLDDEYIDDNTIIMFSKRGIRHILQVDRVEEQSYAENLAIQLYLHVWGAVKFLKWCPIIIYKNENLSKLPN